jgi:hypothetical protein
MNDIYEYKARKYKYKYLKLKYFAEGGWKGRVTVNKMIDKLSNFSKISRDKNKVIDNSKQATQEQKNFKDKLISLRESIKESIKESIENPLLIYGNINYYDIFYNKNNKKEKIEFTNKMKNDKYEQVKLIIDKNISLKINKGEGIEINDKEEHLHLNQISDHILKNKKNDENIVTNSHDPLYELLLCFCRIFKNNYSTQTSSEKEKYKNNLQYKNYVLSEQSTVVTEKEISKGFEEIEKKYPDTFKIFNNKFTESKKGGIGGSYTMSLIFLSIFSNYYKNINYYSIAMIINNLYEIFIEYFRIVETCIDCTTEKKSQALPGLFQSLKDDYNNHKITRDTFLTQLNVIIDCIKD